MRGISRVVCPVDFSEVSERVVGHALRIAAWYHAEVHLVHVLGKLSFETSARVRGVSGLERFLTSAREARIRVHSHIAEGDPTRQIVSYADAHKADLIVMGTHGRQGVEHLVLGSVAERVLRQARCPVMTVFRAPLPPSTAGPLFGRIVCALDFLTPSNDVLRQALALAQQTDAFLTVLHVIEAEEKRALLGRAHVSVADYERFIESQAGARIRDAMTAGVEERCRVREVIRSGSDVAAEIVDMAAEDGADLIVMGVHEGGRRSRAHRASTTREVVRRAACPVLSWRGGRPESPAESAEPVDALEKTS